MRKLPPSGTLPLEVGGLAPSYQLLESVDSEAGWALDKDKSESTYINGFPFFPRFIIHLMRRQMGMDIIYRL